MAAEGYLNAEEILVSLVILSRCEMNHERSRRMMMPQPLTKKLAGMAQLDLMLFAEPLEPYPGKTQYRLGKIDHCL